MGGARLQKLRSSNSRHFVDPLRNRHHPRLSSAKLGHTGAVAEAEVPIAMSEPWLSADDISTHLGVTKDTIYLWIADKAMPAHKVGRLWKFQASEVDEWVRSGGAAVSDETSPPG
jgi:excisionase family DNA binding protein